MPSVREMSEYVYWRESCLTNVCTRIPIHTPSWSIKLIISSDASFWFPLIEVFNFQAQAITFQRDSPSTRDFSFVADNSKKNSVFAPCTMLLCSPATLMITNRRWEHFELFKLMRGALVPASSFDLLNDKTSSNRNERNAKSMEGAEKQRCSPNLCGFVHSAT